MKFVQTHINGVVVVDLEPRADDRGSFARTFCTREFTNAGIDFVPVNMNVAHTVRRATLRGMHYQTGEFGEQKLVRCEQGSVFDVAVDVRPESPTFHQWFGIELSGTNNRQLLVPTGCAHGYLSLTDDVTMSYLVTQFYEAGAEAGLRYDDPAIAIEWPLAPEVITEKDSTWPLV